MSKKQSKHIYPAFFFFSPMINKEEKKNRSEQTPANNNMFDRMEK